MYLLPYLWLLIIFINTSVNEITPRVYGGVDFHANEYKYLVKLIKHYNKNLISICSGSIVNQHWIISSAHCFPDDVIFVEALKPGPVFLPRIGTVKRAQIITYPGYMQDDSTLLNLAKDLALLKTTRRIKFGDYVQPVQLPRSLVAIGQAVVISGYGNAEPGLTEPRAGSAFVTTCEFRVNTTLVCTYGSVRAGSGDSGGPLVSEDVLVGVTSASCKKAEEKKDCVTTYVDVFLNLDWIENIISSC